MDHDKVAEGVSKLLLAPMYLVYDILTGLLPGILFGVLIAAKGLHAPTAALSSVLLGYKTKIILGLLLSYIVGRLFRTPFELLLFWLLERELKKFSGFPLKAEAADFIQKFLMGALALPRLFSKVQPLDLFVLLLANTVFSLTTGAVLLVAAAIPGDGHLRVAEATAGILLLLSVFSGLRRLMGSCVTLIGGLVDLPAMLGPLANISALLTTVVQKNVSQTSDGGAGPSSPSGPSEPEGPRK